MVQSTDSRDPRAEGAPPSSFALWRLGFRPFYLLAAGFASLSIGLWGAQYAGWLTTPYLRGPIWHAHELVFGFAMAVMAGFLFTAVRNWTSRSTPTGAWLAALAALWVAGRILVLTPFAIAAAVTNVLFPIAVAIGIAIPLARSRNSHNLFFVALLVAMAAAQLVTHLAQLGLTALPEWLGIQAALDIILLVMTVLGGRVIPMFTRNGLPNAQVGRNSIVDRLVPVAMLALLFADVLSVPAWLLAIVCVVGAVLHVARVLLWRPWQALPVPLLWILHVGYAWIPVHLALRAMSQFGLVAPPLATHAMTVGAVGALTLGMMVRTARGHTARPLVADRYEVAAFTLVTAAAITRVVVPLVAMDTYGYAVKVSAIMWSAAFAIYAVRYWPILTRPRVDGAPG